MERGGRAASSGSAAPTRPKYAALVKAAYPAIKAVQPNDIVVTGATTGNNFDFIEALYGTASRATSTPSASTPTPPAWSTAPTYYYRDEQGKIGRYTFTGYREVHSVMARHGDGDKPIWMTELGWNTQRPLTGSCNTGMWAGQKPLGVTEDQQAEFLAQAYRCLAADPYVEVALWFGLQDIPGSKYAAGYGLFRANGSAKPSAAAFKALAGGISPQRAEASSTRPGPTS